MMGSFSYSSPSNTWNYPTDLPLILPDDAELYMEAFGYRYLPHSTRYYHYTRYVPSTSLLVSGTTFFLFAKVLVFAETRKTQGHRCRFGEGINILPVDIPGEMDALSLTQENIINLHKSKRCTKIHKSQNPIKYTFVLAR